VSAEAPRWGRAPLDVDTVCWDCQHESDEHTGAEGSCIAYVIRLERETFCLCRCFTPDSDN
jgi:hypothetical protein